MDAHSDGQPSTEHRVAKEHQSAHRATSAAGCEGQPKTRARGAGNPGNFANNREKAVEAGRRGGQHSHGGGGAGNNPGNFANNRQRAAEAGRKGGMQPRR